MPLETIPRDAYVLSTKVGRLLEPVAGQPESDQFVDLPSLEPTYDYSRDGVLRSIDESLARLRLDRVDVVMIHDPDDHFEQARDEAFPALYELRSQGVVGAIGAGMNQWRMLARFAREADPDCFLLAGRYTLLDQSGLDELMPLCVERGIGIVLGGPYNSGILASDLSDETTFDYLPAPREVVERARRIKDVVRPPRRAAEGGCAAIRPGPPGGRGHDTGGALDSGDRGEPGDGGPSHTRGPVGGATGGGAHPPGRARAERLSTAPSASSGQALRRAQGERASLHWNRR